MCMYRDQIEDTEYTQTLTTTELAIFTKSKYSLYIYHFVLLFLHVFLHVFLRVFI